MNNHHKFKSPFADVQMLREYLKKVDPKKKRPWPAAIVYEEALDAGEKLLRGEDIR